MWWSGNFRDDDRQPTDRQNQLLKALPLAHVRGVMTEDPINTDLEKYCLDTGNCWQVCINQRQSTQQLSTDFGQLFQPSQTQSIINELAYIIERLGAGLILVAPLAIFLSYFYSTRHLYIRKWFLYTDMYGDTITCDQGLMIFTIM